MLAEQDLQTLQEAGITSVDSLATAAAAFLRAHVIDQVQPISNALSEQEEEFLRQGGAVGVGELVSTSIADNVTIIAGEFAQMVATSLSQKDVASLLGVGTSRIRQRLDSGSLYSIEGPTGRVCPKFQFTEDSTLPGLDIVLNAINRQAHPVAVQRFFLTESPDLESEALQRSLSPRDWLRTGHSPEDVVLLAKSL